MSSKENQEEVENLEELQEAPREMTLDRIAENLNKNQKSVINVLSGVVLIIVAYFLLQNMYYGPKEAESKEILFKAQILFEDYSFEEKNSIGQSYYEMALEGDDSTDVIGFLEIIEEYPTTKAANLSHFYAGIIYLHKKEYETAIEHLKAFSSDDLLISTKALSGIGDAYAEMGQTEEAIKYYKEASKNNPNSYLTPINLLKLGQALESMPSLNDAKACYEKIKSEYPNSPEGLEIDKYIARVNAKI